jgi:DDE superfamily endonuclease
VIILGFLAENLKMMAVAGGVQLGMGPGGSRARRGRGPGPSARRAGSLPAGVHGCFTARADALFELCDSVLCAEGPVKTLAGLSLAPEHRRGHGALYDAVNAGRIDVARLRWSLAALPLPAWPDGRIRLGADVSSWLRPAAPASPGRLFCHVYCRGKGQAQMIPGWPYSVIAALEPGRTSWTAPPDAIRAGPDDDETEVTAARVRGAAGRLAATGHWREGDPDIPVVFDAGYDIARLAFLLAGLPVEVCGRLRSDRVLCLPAPPRGSGRPSRHGQELKLAGDKTWPEPKVVTRTETTRYGTAIAQSRDRLHSRLAGRGAWQDHDGELPVIEGPAWLWSSRTGADTAHVDLLWQAFLRRFDLEHTFRLFKQVPGWTAAAIRDPAAADRRAWIIIGAYAQLRLARSLTADLRRPREKPAAPGRLTPARVRRGFRHLREKTACPAGAPKPAKPGPGRPPGSKNRRPAARHDVGKHRKANTAIKKTG